MKTPAEVDDRIRALRLGVRLDHRERIRAVMNGGKEGVKAILAWNKEYVQDLGDDLMTANVMLSGLERLAQKVGRPPTLKTDMIPTADTMTARDKAEKRARIVSGWDETQRFELQFPQIGRWLPGYGMAAHVIKERVYGNQVQPVAELRDPFGVYPGQWGVDQQPTEMASVRSVVLQDLLRSYPELKTAVMKRYQPRAALTTFGREATTNANSGWEGHLLDSIDLVEYFDEDGTHLYVPEYGERVSFIPNPLTSGPTFVLTKRFSFDQMIGQYDHTYGLMMMLAKLNILGLMGVEDANFRETNIIGEMVGNTYQRGRKAVNQFEPGTQIMKPTSDQIQQTWQAINILERQFRNTVNYPVAEDGQSPNSFATGAGIQELGQPNGLNVSEYQTAIKHSVELIDMKRLEWEEKMHPKTRKMVFWYEGGNHFEEHYKAEEDIAGDYRTRRVYGAMATFDENAKVIAGLQLLQARIIDRRTMQENLDGLDNISLINERIDQDMAKEMMIQGLGARFGADDPNAGVILAQIMKDPGKVADLLVELYTPAEQPGMDPAMAAAAAPGGAPQGMAAGPPPAVQTILAQMEAEGGGAMSVGQMQ